MPKSPISRKEGRKNGGSEPKSDSNHRNKSKQEPIRQSKTTNHYGRYDDGLQKVANGFTDLKRDEEVLELSGETRRISAESTVSGERSSVQIRPAPPRTSFNKIRYFLGLNGKRS